MRSFGLLAACAALVAAGCAGNTADAPASPSPADAAVTSPAPDAGFVVTSADFVDGAALPASSKANAFGGQCEGDNLNPQLAWAGAPAGTASFAIIMTDLSAGDFLHWSHADIPATVTEVEAGGAESLAGVGGHLAVAEGSYFGPCPPDPDHSYVFTIYALDTTLGLEAGYRIADLRSQLESHTLAETSITGIAGP